MASSRVGWWGGEDLSGAQWGSYGAVRVPKLQERKEAEL